MEVALGAVVVGTSGVVEGAVDVDVLLVEVGVAVVWGVVLVLVAEVADSVLEATVEGLVLAMELVVVLDNVLLSTEVVLGVNVEVEVDVGVVDVADEVEVEVGVGVDVEDAEVEVEVGEAVVGSMVAPVEVVLALMTKALLTKLCGSGTL